MVWRLSARTVSWSGLYDHSNKKPITKKRIDSLRRTFRIGDKVRIPVPDGDSGFRPNYEEICTVVEKYPHFVVVDHGEWREAVNYVDFLVKGTHIEAIEDEPEDDVYPNAFSWRAVINRFEKEFGNEVTR